MRYGWFEEIYQKNKDGSKRGPYLLYCFHKKNGNRKRVYIGKVSELRKQKRKDDTKRLIEVNGLEAVKIEQMGIDGLIEDACQKQAKLSSYVDKNWKDMSNGELVKVLNLFGINAARLARMFREQRSLSGGENSVEDSLNNALDELNKNFKVDL